MKIFEKNKKIEFEKTIFNLINYYLLVIITYLKPAYFQYFFYKQISLEYII